MWEMWRDIALANRKHVARSLTAFIAELQKFESVLKKSEARGIEKFFADAKARRDNWRALLNRLAAQYPNHALALCGAPEESEASEFAADGWRQNSRTPVVNLCGLLTPRESAAAISQARIFVGHDSGPMHLAAAVQTPCVAIFAARNKPRVWFPYGKQHRIVYHQTDCWGCGLETCIIEKKRCLTSITVDEVITEVRAVLG